MVNRARWDDAAVVATCDCAPPNATDRKPSPTDRTAEAYAPPQSLDPPADPGNAERIWRVPRCQQAPCWRRHHCRHLCMSMLIAHAMVWPIRRLEVVPSAQAIDEVNIPVKS